MKKLLIGLTGPARCGKDTVAGFLMEQGFHRVSFADPLRDAVAAILREPGPELFSDARKDAPVSPGWPKHVTPRLLLQAIGTQGVRNHVDPRFWIWLAAEKYKAFGAPVVVTDVRFLEEAEWVRENGGQIWRILRHTRAEITGIANHASEAGLPMHPDDVTLHNNQSLDQLGYNVRQLLRWMNEDGR